MGLKIVKDEGCGPQCGCAGDAGSDAGGLTYEAVRDRLAGRSGKSYWRSLEELAEGPGFTDMLEREFPRLAMEWPEGVSRRRFLQLSSASFALAGLTACTRQPHETIVPYVDKPEEIVPGLPLYFATAFPMGGYAQGVLAESHLGRPTKLEGNPLHPANPGGGTDIYAQASVLGLYDPDRSTTITRLGRIRTWEQFLGEIGPRLSALRALGGSGLRILSGTVTSPTLTALLEELLAELPGARWHRYEPAGRHNVFTGAERAFGRALDVRYDLSAADVVLALESDFLTQGPGSVRYAHDWAARRRTGTAEETRPNRLYAVETAPSATGSVADHRLAATPSGIARVALAVAAELGVAGDGGDGGGAGATTEEAAWAKAVAADLTAHRGAALVVAGDAAPPEVHVLAHAINAALGAPGRTAIYTEPVAADPVDQVASIAELARDLAAGEVDTVLVFEANPVFDAPADLGFAEALLEAKLRVHMGLYKDETAAYCQWHIPQAHYLESWGDVRAFDGTASIVQPLIDPLFDGKTPIELVAALAGRPVTAPYELVREHWRGRLTGDFETAWRQALHDGVVPDTEAAEAAVAGAAAGGAAAAAAALGRTLAETARGGGGGGEGVIELALRPDPTIYDGSFANNSWLQELPKPISKLTWDNALLVSPETALALGIEIPAEDLKHEWPLVEVTVPGAAAPVTVPIWIAPGHAEGAATLHFGYGRRDGGPVADGAGFDVYPLRTTGAMWHARATVRPTGGVYPLATTQHHHSMHGRNLVRDGTFEQYRENPGFVRAMSHGPDVSFYPGFEYQGNSWGMAVDLNACTGCNACVIACQSENNIPVVGKEQVRRGREMHWLRIDRYYEGDPGAPQAIHHQPILCMHCEQAPCEPVCPVAATVHSHDGLNDMVYNRCVGTRYCSNNCPYKVRRFNFLKYTDHENELLKARQNPDVTVRMRGVMEKCTFCVQRIRKAQIEAKVEGRVEGERPIIPDGRLQTACQQACPSNALIFGDLNNPDAEVVKRKAEPLNYALLEELGTRPRTTYLAKLRNTNPVLAPAAPADEHARSDHGSH